jgi:hypothetical protein
MHWDSSTQQVTHSTETHSSLGNMTSFVKSSTITSASRDAHVSGALLCVARALCCAVLCPAGGVAAAAGVPGADQQLRHEVPAA